MYRTVWFVSDYLAHIGGVKQWEYRPEIKTTEQLWENFKAIIERNNQARLERPLSVTEFNQVKKVITAFCYIDLEKMLIIDNPQHHVLSPLSSYKHQLLF